MSAAQSGPRPVTVVRIPASTANRGVTRYISATVVEAERVVAAAPVVLRRAQPDEWHPLQRDLEGGRQPEAQHALYRELPLGRAAAHARPLVLEAGLDLERAGRHDVGAGGEIRPVGVDVLRRRVRCPQPEKGGRGERGERRQSGPPEHGAP